MPNFNKCIFVGNLTRDPVMRYTGSQKAVADFAIAVNHGSGDRKEAMFLDCTAWEKTAETINEHFTKGKPILVEGRLKLDSWDDKQTGQKRSKHVLVVGSFAFIGGNKDSDDEPERRSAGAAVRERAATNGARASKEFENIPANGEVPEEDIPF